MTISAVRNTSNTADGSATTITSTFAANGSGNFACIGVFYVDGGTISVSTVTDDNGNTWNALTETRNATQGFSEQLWYAYNLISDAGTVTITATFSAATTFRRIHGEEYTSSVGAFTTDPFEASVGTGTGSGTALATGTLTPALNNAVICCAGSSGAGNISAGSGYTLRSPTGGGVSTGFADHIQTTATAETAKLTASSSGQWGVTGAKFNDAVASGGATVTPAAIAASTTLPAPSLSTGSTVARPAIAATTTMPAVTVTAGGATITPAAILASTSIPAVTVTATASTPKPVALLIEAAYGADPDSDLSAAVWSDISTRCRFTDGVYVRAGRHGLGANTDPTQIRLTLNDRDGQWTPFLNTSPNYPNIVRNLPIRVSAAGSGDTPVDQATAFVDSYEMGWDVSTNDTTMVISALGRLARLNRKAVVRSATSSSTVDTDPVAYWPLTDGTSATSAASGLPGGTSMAKSGSLKFGTGDAGPGQPKILDLAALHNSIGTLVGAIPAGTSETSWRMEAKINWPAVTPTNDSTGHVSWSTVGTISGWQINYRHSDTAITLQYTPASGSGPVSLTTSKTAPYDGTARIYRVTADQNGTGIDVVLSIDGVVYLTSTIASHTLGHPTTGKLRTAFSFAAGYTGAQSPAVGGFTFWAPYSAVAVDTIQAAAGYEGELAAVRVQRLCDENGIPVTVVAGDSSAMGVQGDNTLIELLRECEAADGGLLHDNGVNGALVYIPRQARYNALVDLTVDVDLKNLQPGFRPTYDGRDLLTAAKVSQPDGTSGSYAMDSAEGVEERPFTLNLADSENLAQHAAWRVALGSPSAMRYAKVGLNFRRNPELVDTWLATRGIGMRLDVTNLPSQHPVFPVSQFSEGYEMRLTDRWWSVDLDCVPADPYEVIRLNSSAATLVSAVDADDVTFTSVASASPRWTTTDEPVAIAVGGETPIIATTIADVAIAFVASGVVAHANNASVTPGMPAGVTAGDLLLILAAIRGTTATINVPAGYTRMVGWHNFTLLGKIHDGSEADPTVTFTGGSAGDDTSARMTAFRNTVADPAAAVVDFRDWLNRSAQDIAYPPLGAPKYDGCVLLYLGWKAGEWTTVAQIAGATELFENDTLTGNDQGIVADMLIQTTAAAIPTGSFAVTGGAGALSRGMIVAIAPGRSTLTVTRATNGTAIAHSAGDQIQVANTGHLGL